MIQSRPLFHILIVALLSFAAMGSCFYYGITTGNDFHQHFQFADTIYNSIATGEIYPGLAPAANYGLGDVALRFYPPFSYYLLSATYFISGSWYFAGLATFWLVFFVGGIGLYQLAREEFSPRQSLFAAAVYIFVPYHLNEIYNNFLFAEFVATAILPFCFLYITRICRGGGYRAGAGLSISYALLVLSHLPLTIIGSLAFAIYACFLVRKERFLKTAAQLSAGAAGGLVLSSFYWVRMLRELDWVKHSSYLYFTDSFSAGRNFLLKPSNWLNFQDDVLALWFADLMLVAVLLLAVPSLVFLIKDRRTSSKFIKGSAALLFFSVFMTTPLSGFIWAFLPFLQKVQFPWRWMAIVSVSGAVFASAGIMRAADAMKQSKNVLLPAGLGAILIAFVFMAAFVIKQAVHIPREQLSAQMATIAGDPSFEGWWPVWARESAFAQKEKVVIHGRETVVGPWQPKLREFTIGPGENGIAGVGTFYYPHWRATVNGSPVDVSPTADGLISLPVPAGESTVRLEFVEPVLNRATFYISAAGWILVFGILVMYKKRQKITTK